MTIAVGDRLPEGKVLKNGESGPEEVSLTDLLAGKKVALFGLPGAYTGTCTTAHVPSFIRSMGALADKGVDTVICLSVNDPFVMGAWGDSTGATAAGITMLADASGAYVKALGLDFDAPPVGLYGRSKRFALYAEDGVVKVLNLEDSPGVCNISAGETLVAAI